MPTATQTQKIDAYCKFHAAAAKYAKYTIRLNNITTRNRNESLGDAIRQKLLQNARDAQTEYKKIMGWQ